MSLPDDFIPGVKAPAAVLPKSLAFAFRDRRLLVHKDGEAARVPDLREIETAELGPVRSQYLGTYRGRDVVSFELPDAVEAPQGMNFTDLRSLFFRLDEPLFWIAAHAVQIVAWDRDHQICGRCGTGTEDHPKERSKRCPNCGLTHYPRLAPAVIVVVERGDEVLLGRSPHFPPGMFSTLAGFVEPGESLEQAVVREALEETGVHLGEVHYHSSQPWPFPSSLMLGYVARATSHEIQRDDDELEDARWFSRDDIALGLSSGALRVPRRVSIAYRLVEHWFDAAPGARLEHHVGGR